MNTFLEVSHVLHNFEGNYLEPGYYSFPFSFLLPTWVPSSFIYSGSKAKKLSILYTIKARMEDF